MHIPESPELLHSDVIIINEYNVNTLRERVNEELSCHPIKKYNITVQHSSVYDNSAQEVLHTVLLHIVPKKG